MQRWSNNAVTTLADALSDSATSLTVVASAGFASLSAGQHELITLESGTLREIVKVTARAGNAWTVARAQEGTTARAWPAGTQVQARLTAGTLAGLTQTALTPDLAALDHGGNARGTGAVNIQSGRATVERVASGPYAVALGYNARSEYDHAVSVGNGAQVVNAYSGVAVGHGASVSALAGVAIGKDAAVAASSDYAIAIGNGSDATSGAAVALGYNALATSVGTVAIGHNASTAFAMYNSNYSVAIGYEAKATATYAVALGAYAQANFGTITIRGRSYSESSTVIGRLWGTSRHSLLMSHFHTVPRDEWSDGAEYSTASAQAVFCTPYVDLGVPSVWAATTAYDNGDVVKPTTGGDVQYRAWTDSDATTGIHAAATSTATEPTWPGAGDSVDLDADGDHSWIGIDWTDGYLTESIPAGLAFFPTELAFICHEFSTITGTPNISIGTAATPGLLVDADDVTITAAHQIYRFTLANPTPAIPSGTAIKITVNTSAGAGRCAGRFLLSGYFVENPTNAV